ncbi:Prefoldin subunit 3 [Gymnopus androsaceus JB14]|uniref:Prefoldin subunit 3 n=1 Tax=Gymnopus androsaceus JB14 TaxID=1447944 RepID=A0A6A4GYJ8_9AGAR|nr:Prefoldin subunit 3 [Gymnopus androsaceus JB14]
MASDSVLSEERGARGIPKAPFIEDVEKFLGSADAEVEGPLKKIQDAIAKYRYMDANLNQRRLGLEEKIPDIKKTLSMVEYLQQRREGKSSQSEDDLEDDLEESPKPLKTTFELNETLFAEAELEDTDTVFLWLGANVMLSYKIPAAIELLRAKLQAAEANVASLTEDLEFLREQLTMMEVNMARVYNWDVKRRRDRRLEDEKTGKGASEREGG